MFAKTITNFLMIAGGGIGGAGFNTHPKLNWTEIVIGGCIAFIGMVFRGLAEK